MKHVRIRGGRSQTFSRRTDLFSAKRENTRRVDKRAYTQQCEQSIVAIDSGSEALHYTAMRQLSRTIPRRLHRTTLRRDGSAFHAFEYLT